MSLFPRRPLITGPGKVVWVAALLAAAGAVVACAGGVSPGPATSAPGSDRVPGVTATDAPPVEAPPPALDPVRVLEERLATGEVELAWDSVRGYLPSVLEALDIPVWSQTLVFSRTSFQTDRVAPWAPRALYFNDDVYLGWVQEGPIMELVSMTPQDGARFYSVIQQPDHPPRFNRESDTCLLCHESRITEGVPGLIMRSTLTDRLGYPVTQFHTGSTRDQTPFEARWGGWYVTGTHGEASHAGNLRSTELYEDIIFPDRHAAELDKRAGANQSSLSQYFDVTPYLTPHSDLVALMVLAHQVRVHNLMELVRSSGAAAGGASTIQRAGARYLPITQPASGSSLDRLMRAILFADEVDLEGPVTGTSEFTREFPRVGPLDQAGRGLREFDLTTRLFRYPVSYLIYTPSFDALPRFARDYVYDGILEALTLDRLPDAFAHLRASDRTAILEIVSQTKPDFARRADTATGR